MTRTRDIEVGLGKASSPEEKSKKAGEVKNEIDTIAEANDAAIHERLNKYLLELKARGYLLTNADRKEDPSHKDRISKALRQYQDDKNINEQTFQKLMQEWIDKKLLNESQIKMLFELVKDKDFEMSVCNFLLTTIWLGDPSLLSSEHTPPANMAIECIHHLKASLKKANFLGHISYFNAGKSNQRPLLRFTGGHTLEDAKTGIKYYYYRNLMLTMSEENQTQLLVFQDGAIKLEPLLNDERLRHRTRNGPCKEAVIRSEICGELEKWQLEWNQKQKSGIKTSYSCR